MLDYGMLDKYTPYTIGFEHILNKIEELSKLDTKQVSFPPYNIYKIDDTNYIIEIAVAGYKKENIEIEVKDNILSVTVKNNIEDNKKYVFKGIANRSFVRTFKIADTVEIKKAELVDGMLTVQLQNIIPEHKKPKKITID